MDMAVAMILSPGVSPDRVHFPQSLSQHFTTPVLALRCWPGPSAIHSRPVPVTTATPVALGEKLALVGSRRDSG